jgi:predicted nucleotidyltransferase
MDENIIEKIKILALQAKEYFAFEKVIIFGSFVNGNFNQNSDIDVAFIVDHISNNHFELSSKLFELVDCLDTRIEPIIVNKNYDKSGFYESISKSGLSIN